MATALKSVLAASAGILVAGATVAGAQPGATEPLPVDPEEAVDAPPTEVLPVTPAPIHVRAGVPERSAGPWGGGVRLTGLSGVGALPGVNYGAEVAAYLRYDEHFLELAMGHWAPQETFVVAESPKHVELALDVWTLRGGWASKTMPLRAWLLVESGELAGTHQVADTIARMVGAVDKERRWLAAGAGFGVAWPMSDQARLVGSVEFAVPMHREEMMMQAGSPFEPAAAAARANLGIEVGWR